LLLSIGVMTMKMIRSTSITSTMGVTLMLEFTFLPSSRFAIDMFLRSVRSIRMFLNFSVAVWTSVPQAYRLIFPSDPGGND
jgi:hypothetical protein